MSSQGQQTGTPEIAQPTPEELKDDHNHNLPDEGLKLMRAGIKKIKAERGPGQKRQWIVKRLRSFLKVMKKALGQKSMPTNEAMIQHWDKIYYALFGRQSSECFGNVVIEWVENLHDWNGDKALGVSEWKDGKTILQIKMDPNAESEYQLLETLLHEMCHAVIWYTCCMGQCGEATCKELTKKWVHENYGHGYHWQTLADTLGEKMAQNHHEHLATLSQNIALREDNDRLWAEMARRDNEWREKFLALSAEKEEMARKASAVVEEAGKSTTLVCSGGEKMEKALLELAEEVVNHHQKQQQQQQ